MEELADEEISTLNLFKRIRNKLIGVRTHQRFADCSLALVNVIEAELDPSDADDLQLLSYLADVRRNEYLRSLHSANSKPFIESRVAAVASTLEIGVHF